MQFLLRLALLLILPILGACHAPAAQEEASTPTHPELQTKILDMAAQDQAVRQEWIDVGVENASQDLMMRLMMTDLQNTAEMKKIIENHGWPSVEMIGQDGVKAAFLLVQHADKDPNFQRQMLPHIRAAYEKGQISGQEVALLTDRVLIAYKKPQRYGTQADIVDGEIVFKPVEDPEQLDQRRAQMGLPSMDEYLKLLRQAYQLEPKGS